MTADYGDLAPSLRDAFEWTYHRSPQWIARAPGRVNLIGEHTDYNDGFVLPMAIERDTVVAAAFNGSNTVRWRTTEAGEAEDVDLTQIIEPRAKGHWVNYPLGVIAGFLKAGYSLRGFDALVHSTVPVGAGLSSSAALELATATLLEAILGERLPPLRKALLCQTAEHDYADVPCGIMDQFVCTLGAKDHLLLLDCRSQEVEQIAFADPSVSVLIINSHIKHQLANGEYAARRAQCERATSCLEARALRDVTGLELDHARDRLDSVIYHRARHVVGEISRTREMAERIRQSDWQSAGELMYQSHESLRSDYEVSCAEIDGIVESAHNLGLKGGVFGCRMTGGGFGGCAVALIQASAESSITRTLEDEYVRRTGISPTIFSSRAAEGASILWSRQ